MVCHLVDSTTWLIHGKYLRSSLDPVYSQEVEELEVEALEVEDREVEDQEVEDQEVEDQEVEEQERVVVVVKARALTG